MSLRRFARLSTLSLAALALAACATTTEAPEPGEAPAAEAQPGQTAAELALIAEAQAAEDTHAKVTLLEQGHWAGGDFAHATIEHSERGDAVAVRFTHDEARVDLVYTFDEDGKRMSLVRPADEASARVFEQSVSEEDEGLQGASVDDLAGLVAEPDVDLGPAETQAALPCGHLLAGKTIHSGEKLWSCKNGYALYMQPDGNLVLYAPGSRATWSSHTNGKGGYRATMQKDGNFVVYDRHNKALWASSHRRAGDQLDLRNDGNLVKDTCGDVSWSSGTNCESGCIGVCKKWSCAYKSSVGNHPSCFSLNGNPFGRYHYQTIRWGRTVPGFCGTGLYADYRGYGISCPSSHVLKVFVCD